MLHAQVGAVRDRRERPQHDALHVVGRIVVRKVPGVGEFAVRLDGDDLAVQRAPVLAQVEVMADLGLEVVLHEPFLDELWLGERSPDLLGRKRYVAFDDDGKRFSGAHGSILLSRSSSSSNRDCQKPAIWLVQYTSGANACTRAR